MKKNVLELEGLALDYAVAMAIRKLLYRDSRGHCVISTVTKSLVQPGVSLHPWRPSKDWAQAGPLIASEGISSSFSPADEGSDEPEWVATDRSGAWAASGATALIAAMRCVILSKESAEVDIPDYLVTHEAAR